VRTTAVIFDFDGVLVDSEPVWRNVLRAFAEEHGGVWQSSATRDMQGMSTREWGSYLVSTIGVRLSPDEAAARAIAEMRQAFAVHLPVIPGAVEAVHEVAARCPVAIASSSPAVLISMFLEMTGLPVPVVVSSEECVAGKPSPDVYLLAAARLEVAPAVCCAVEDSTNGLRAALAAGMTALAVPNPRYPPDPSVLADAVVLASISELPGAVARINASAARCDR
jgi:HAD superfamily hydrolase (TIGR01509 family)